MHQRYMEQFVKQTYFEFVTTSVLIWSYMYICDMRFNCCNLLGNLLKGEDLDYNIGYACKRNKKKLMYLLVVMFLFAVSFCVFPISYFIYINPDSKHKKTNRFYFSYVWLLIWHTRALQWCRQHENW